MTWLERIDLILSIAAHVPWRWFAAGAICGMVLGAVIVGVAVVIVGLESDKYRQRKGDRKWTNTK